MADAVVSSFCSVLYSASFDMNVVNYYIQGARNCRRFAKTHKSESITGSRFVKMEFCSEGVGRTGHLCCSKRMSLKLFENKEHGTVLKYDVCS